MFILHIHITLYHYIFYTTFSQARLFDEFDLASLCMETIDLHTNEAILAEGFLDVDYDTLCSVLERDTLQIRENKLFLAVDRFVAMEIY